MGKAMNKFSPEVRDRAVRLVRDNEGQHGSRWQAIMSIAAKIGCSGQTLNEWVKKTEVDSGKRAGVPPDLADRLKALERENRELRQANEILRKASAYFAMAELDRRSKRWCRSSMPIGVSTGSSRSASCCRSPLPATTPTGRSGPIRPGCRIVPGGTRRLAPKFGGFRGELAGPWRAQGLAAIAAGRLRYCPLHGRAADEDDGHSRRHPGQTAQNDDRRQEGAMPAGQGEPPVPRACAEQAVGVGFHLRRHLERVRPCRLRHRLLCPQDRRLARQRIGTCGLRPGCLGTGRP